MAITQNFPQTREADLVAGSNRFATYIAANAVGVGLNSTQATAFAALNTAWVAAYNVVSDPSTRNKPALVAKDLAKREMLRVARQLIGIIQKFPGTSDVERAAMQITIPAARTPNPVPDVAPILVVKSVAGNVVTLDAQRPDTKRRSLPPKVENVGVYSFIGVEPDPDPSNWKFEGSCTRASKIVVEFPLSAEPFSKVWLTASYANRRGQTGVAATPISTNLGTWMVQAVEGRQPLSHLRAA